MYEWVDPRSTRDKWVEPLCGELSGNVESIVIELIVCEEFDGESGDCKSTTSPTLFPRSRM